MTDYSTTYSRNSRPQTAGAHKYNEAIKAAQAMPTADMLKPYQAQKATHTRASGIYSPITGSWMINPASDAYARPPKDYSLTESTRMAKKILPPPGASGIHPVLQVPVAKEETLPPRPATASRMETTLRRDPGWHHDHDRGRHRPAMVDAFGDYNPILGQWTSRPTDPRREDRESGYYKTYASARRRVDHFAHSTRMGVYDPVKNMWIVPPKDKRVWNGNTFSARIIGLQQK